MTYKRISHIRRTPQELKDFRQAKDAFMRQGYPEHVAEQYCWDIMFAARRGRKQWQGVTI